MNVLITGANRGIGLAFTRHYLERGDSVWACFRNDPGGLRSLGSASLHRLCWDVSDYPGQAVLDSLPARIDLLVNNAGIYGPGKHDGQSLEKIRPQDMLHVFDVDCVGALRVVQATLDRLVAARGIIANVSSKMGSTGDNSSGDCYAYRAAKAALVIVSRSMGVDLAPRGVRVITLHPGWVKTDMTGHTGEIDAPTSVAGMCRVIDNVDRYAPGAFVAWDGETVPY